MMKYNIIPYHIEQKIYLGCYIATGSDGYGLLPIPDLLPIAKSTIPTLIYRSNFNEIDTVVRHSLMEIGKQCDGIQFVSSEILEEKQQFQLHFRYKVMVIITGKYIVSNIFDERYKVIK